MLGKPNLNGEPTARANRYETLVWTSSNIALITKFSCSGILDISYRFPSCSKLPFQFPNLLALPVRTGQ